jgi:hypothetical protein
LKDGRNNKERLPGLIFSGFVFSTGFIVSLRIY